MTPAGLIRPLGSPGIFTDLVNGQIAPPQNLRPTGPPRPRAPFISGEMKVILSRKAGSGATLARSLSATGSGPDVSDSARVQSGLWRPLEAEELPVATLEPRDRIRLPCQSHRSHPIHSVQVAYQHPFAARLGTDRRRRATRKPTDQLIWDALRDSARWPLCGTKPLQPEGKMPTITTRPALLLWPLLVVLFEHLPGCPIVGPADC